MASTMPLVLILLPLAVLTVGAIFLSIGLRGRAVDNHPVCRQCGFDLFGLAELVRCPECGTELSAAKIRLGHRKVRAWPVAFGLAMLVPSVLLLALVTFVVVRHVDMNRYKPVWWLLRERDAGALGELNTRLAANRLSAGQVENVVAAALAAQADLSRPFQVEWGDFIETARAGQKVKDDAWERYLRQAVPFTFAARSNIHRIDPIPVQVTCGPARTGSTGRFRVEIALRRSVIGGGGGRNPLTGAVLLMQFGRTETLPVRYLASIPDASAALPEGRSTLKVPLEVTTQQVQSTGPGFRLGRAVKRDVELSAEVNVLPPNEPTVEVVNDPSLQNPVQGSLAIGSRGARQIRVDGRYLDFAVIAANPPVGLAFDVYVRDPAGREWPIGQLVCRAGGRKGLDSTQLWRGFDADRADVIFRPNPEAAAMTVDVARVWGSEVRFRDVPVVWEERAHRPMRLGREPTSARSTLPTTRPAR